MIINKKIKRTMLESKSQYFGSIALIILSCLLFAMMNLLADNMSVLLSSFEKNSVQEDASFITAGTLNNIQELESKFGARIEEGSTFDYMMAEGRKLRIFRQNTAVNIPAIVEGNALSGNDILIDPAFAKANGLEIGGTLQLLDRTFKIAGFTSLPNYIYLLESENDIMSNPQNFGIAVVSKEDFSKFNRGSSFYSIKFNPGSDVEAQAAKLRDYLKNENTFIVKWNDIGENPRVMYVTVKIEGINKVATAMPIAILLLTCIMTGIVIRRLLKRESVIIGTLYAQGYRKKEIVRHYLMYPLTVALVGGLAGTVMGALLLKPMLAVMVEFFNIPVSALSFNPAYVLASILLPVVFLVISGLFVLGRTLRHSPVELMRGANESGRVNFIERRLRLDRLKFPVKFRIREQLRSPSRLTFLLLGVVMATMLLLLGFTAKSSMDFLSKDSIRDTYKFQYEYVFRTLQTGQAPSNTDVFNASSFTLKSDSKTTFVICGLGAESKYISLRDKSGTELNKDRIIITKPLADRLGVVPGDTVNAVNKLDSREYAVTVESVADTYIGELIYMPLIKFDELLGMPRGSYAGLWSDTKLDIQENQLFSVRTVEDSIKAFEVMTQPLQATIGIISFLSFIIGLIVIYVVTSLIIEENKNNISLMKVFGYRRKEVNSLILNSSSIVIAAGYIIGIPLILILMKELFRSLTDSIRLTVPVLINYTYILAGFAVIYIIYELSKALSRKKIERISMSEALKAGAE